MKKSITLVVSIILYTTSTILGQQKSTYNDFDVILEKVIQYSENEQYFEAAQELEKVNPNDSIYFDVLSTASYYYLIAEEYDKCIDACNKGINDAIHTPKYYFYVNKIAALSKLNKNEAAITLATEALKLYPKSHTLLFNRAISYEETENLEKAIQDLKESIQYNPFYEKSHLRLALLCHQQNQTAQAIMCLNTYLMLTPESEYSQKVLVLANEIASRRAPMDAKEKVSMSKSDEDFEEINLILNNKIALSKKYKTKNKIRSSFAVQSHILIEQLKNYNKTNGFWNEKYIPLFQWIAKNNYYNYMVYTTHYSSSYYKYKNVARKNTGMVKSFLTKFYEQWGEMAGKSSYIDDQGHTHTLYHIYDDYLLSGIGEMKDDKPHGQWDLYDENGALSSFGRFDHNKKEGLWTLQNDKGEIVKQISYNNDERDGQTLSFENNVLQQKANFTQGEVDGEVINYSPRGAIMTKMNYKKGALDGPYISFFKNGISKNYELTYANDTAKGTINYYFKNGALYSTLNLKNDMRNGLEKTFYSDSAIYSELYYKDNLLDGEQKYYFHNGQISSTGKTTAGIYEGEWKEYYMDGTIETSTQYSKGEIDGIQTNYNSKGQKESEYTYKRGNFIGYKYYDKEGKIISEGRKQNGNFMFNSINQYGEPRTSGLYSVKGGKTGEWKYYNRNGVLTSSENYSSEGYLEGKTTTYFNDGAISTESNYENDTLNGSYYSYYMNGNIHKQGHYKNGNLEGEWVTFYINGNPSNIAYYNNDKLFGKSTNYTIDGFVSEVNYFYNDIIYKQEIYSDTTKNFIAIEAPFDSLSVMTQNYLNGNIKSKIQLRYNYYDGEYSYYYPKGALQIKGDFLAGDREGVWTWFHENGKIKTQGQYRLGDKHGIWRYYFENGQLETETNYVLGKEHGLSKTYNKDGILLRESEYNYGENNGYRKFYSEEGNLQLIRYYENDYLIGYSYLDKNGKEVPMIEVNNETAKIVSYFDNGKVARSFEFYKGKFNSTYKEYYYSGQLSEIQTYINGANEGDHIVYYPNGTIKEKSFYKSNRLEGQKKYYYTNGKIKQTSNYIGGYLVGEELYFNEQGEKTKTLIYFNDEVIDEK